jgi:hypothetical protein
VKKTLSGKLSKWKLYWKYDIWVWCWHESRDEWRETMTLLVACEGGKRERQALIERLGLPVPHYNRYEWLSLSTPAAEVALKEPGRLFWKYADDDAWRHEEDWRGYRNP